MLATLAAETSPPQPDPAIRHVVLVSVDGLRPEMLLPDLVDVHPGLVRLTRGPHTLQARCDPDLSITLPNHLDMLTGRPVTGERGHQWTGNADPPARAQGGTLHARGGAYLSSMFDVAHDHGLRTGVVCGKWKFVLLEQSYGEDAGGPDQVKPDDGKDKIDLFLCDPQPRSQLEHVVTLLERSAAERRRSLVFWHIPSPDFAGHAKGWDLTSGSDYRRAVAEADAALAMFLQRCDADPELRGRVAVVLTADHGGGVPFISHSDPEAPVNFTIPLVAWLGRDEAAADLYDLNPGSRRRPGPTERFAPGSLPPIRNGDAGNLALHLLGLPAIPGSSINAAQDLAVRSDPAPATSSR
ncbi:MAG: hypothetical protein EBQ99_08230 [Planctomycetes bacterium]|nr:hypothetical protein [Planctomycetota bacterium]